MFPVALLSGILFPIIAAEVQASVGDRMNSTGLTALLNTTGAAIGPLVASFVLLPILGYQTSLICCAAGYALLSLLVTERARLVVSTTCRDHRHCDFGPYSFLVWYFFHTDAPRRISHMRAVPTKWTTRAKCWRAL